MLAQEEARLLKHNYIGTEHILMGLLHEGEGVAAKVLDSLDVDLATLRADLEERIPMGEFSPSGHIPFTPRSKKVLECSLREALQLGHNYIGTEHVLLGLLREGEGMGATLLTAQGVDLHAARSRVIEILSGYERPKTTFPDDVAADPNDEGDEDEETKPKADPWWLVDYRLLNGEATTAIIQAESWFVSEHFVRFRSGHGFQEGAVNSVLMIPPPDEWNTQTHVPSGFTPPSESKTPTQREQLAATLKALEQARANDPDWRRNNVVFPMDDYEDYEDYETY